jgi:ribosomal protein S18 acetylase RimI-like enzyme
MEIRVLTPDDASAYRELRLAALRDHPTAFCTDFSEEAGLPIEEFQKRLTAGPATITYGALDGEQLVGIGTLNHPQRVRQRFRATIGGLYVVPSHRQRGIAMRLLQALVNHARTLLEVEEVLLCFTVGNDSAKRVYAAFGFQPDFVDPRYFKYEGRLYDLEWMRLGTG